MRTTEKPSGTDGTRVDEFAFLKAFPILGLALVHVPYDAAVFRLANESLTDFLSTLFIYVDFGPAIFMLCMGYGIAGVKSSPVRLMRQGFQFLLINAILNVCRYVLPNVLRLAIGITPWEDPLMLIFESDIYYFVGLFFLFYALMRRLRVSSLGMLLITVLMVLVVQLLKLLRADTVANEYLASFLANFYDLNGESGFALLAWSFVPAVGICLGEWLKRTSGAERTRAMRRVLACSSVFLVALWFNLHFFGIGLRRIFLEPDGSWNFLYASFIVAVSLVLVALARELCLRIAGTRFYRYIMRLSASIMPFYILQWVFIAWEMFFLQLFGLPSGKFGFTWYILSTVVITVACAFLSTRFGMKIMKPLLRFTAPWNYRRSKA